MSGDFAVDDVDQALAAAGWFDAADAGVPHVVLQIEPVRILWASSSAKRMVPGRATSDEMSHSLGMGGSRFAARVRRLRPGGPPLLERFHIHSGFHADPATLICKAVESRSRGTLVVVQIEGRSARFVAATLDNHPRPLSGTTVSSQPAFSTPAAAASRLGAPEDDGRQTSGDGTDAAAPARPSRFVWQTDSAGTVIRIGPELEAAVGETAIRVGERLPARLEALGAPHIEDVLSAIEAGRSWSRLDVQWPVESTEIGIYVLLSGAPGIGSEGGYSGFGLVRAAHQSRILPGEAVMPARQAPQKPAPTEPEPVVPDGTPVVSRESGDALSETLLTSEDAEILDAPEVLVDPVALPSPESEPAATNLGPSKRGGGATPDPAKPERGSKVVHLSSFKIASGAIAGQPVRPAATARKQQPADPPPSLEAPLWSETPGQSSAPDGASPDPKLSSNERFNFDEIARALGARTGSDPAGRRRPDPAPDHDATGAGVGEQDRHDTVDEVAALLHALPIGVLVTRGEQILYANTTILDLLGFVDTDALRAAGGVPFIFGGRSPPSVRQENKGWLLTAQDGSTMAVEARVQGTSWNGEAASLISFRRPAEQDVGARLDKVALELDRSRSIISDLNTALDLAVAGVGFLNPDGRLVSVNAGAERLFGYDQREMVGKACVFLVAPDHHAAWTSFFKGFASPNGARRATAFRRFAGRKRNGDALDLAASLRWLGAEKICIVWSDDTHRRSTDRAAHQGHRPAEQGGELKADFLAKVSHEIRTPLTAMLGFTEIIMEERFGPVGNERYKEYLRDIHGSGKHVMSLVNDLLDLSRIEAGGLDLTLGSVDANGLVGECVGTMQSQAHRERIIIRTSLAAQLPPALADERAMRQILLNLLANAVKFNEPGGQVIVSTTLSDSERVVIRIRDTGLGMSDEEIETAMKPFRQLATPKTGAGSGLGLPLTKALVDASRGRMTIKSRPREGTLVELSFEKAPAEALVVPAE